MTFIYCYVLCWSIVMGVPLLGPSEYFALCPSCRREGALRAARPNGRQTTLAYWCGSCQRSWDVIGTVDVIGTNEAQSLDAGPAAHSPPSRSTDAK
jgi:hypothetical protein